MNDTANNDCTCPVLFRDTLKQPLPLKKACSQLTTRKKHHAPLPPPGSKIAGPSGQLPIILHPARSSGLRTFKRHAYPKTCSRQTDPLSNQNGSRLNSGTAPRCARELRAGKWASCPDGPAPPPPPSPQVRDAPTALA